VLAGGGGGATTISAGLSTGSLGMAPLAAARALQGGLGVAEAANPFFSEIAESVDDAGSEPGRPTTVAARLRGGPDRPGAGGGAPAAGGGSGAEEGTSTGSAGTGTGGAGGPGQPGPAPDGSTPAPTETPSVPVPDAPVPSSEEVAATIVCADLGLLDDPAAEADEFDLCVLDQLAADDEPTDPDGTAPGLTGLLTREDQG